MSNAEVILVGGSRDGSTAENDKNTRAINNIVINEDKSGPEYIDLYLPASVTDKEGRPIYVYVGRYDETESASYWATLSDEEKQSIREAAEAAEAEAAAAESAKQEDESDGDANKESAESTDGNASDEEESDSSEESTEESDLATDENEDVSEVEPEESSKED